MAAASLSECLGRSIADHVLIPDIVATCEMNGITSESLALGLYTASEVADKLFLTVDEAERLLHECQLPLAVMDAEEAKDAEWRIEIVEEGPVIGAVAEATEQPGGTPKTPSLPVSVGVASSLEDDCVDNDKRRVASYLRPTSSIINRSKAVPDTTPEAKVPPPPPKHTNKKYNNIVSKLFAPTTAFVARITGKGPGAKTPPPPKNDTLRQSLAAKVLQSPQGQRVTRAQPFTSHTKTRTRPAEGLQMSTEEAAALQAQKDSFKPLPLPKKVYAESRPLDGVHVASQPKSPEQVFKPFNLSSLDRHAAAQARIEAQLAESKQKEDQGHVFRARQLNQDMISRPLVPPKPAAQPATKPVPLALNAEQRVVRHQQEVAPARRAKLPAAERAKLEAHERELAAEEAFLAEQLRKDKEERAYAAALEKMEVSELRRSMVFKARKMPNLAAAFKPDPAKAQPATEPEAFDFKTDERLGKPKLDPKDRETRFDYYTSLRGENAFASTLRNKFTKKQHRASELSKSVQVASSGRASVAASISSQLVRSEKNACRHSQELPSGQWSGSALPSRVSRPASASTTSMRSPRTLAVA